MEQITLDVTLRSEQGRRAARDLRLQERVPGILYGENGAPQPITIDMRVFKSKMRLHEEQALAFQLTLLDGEKKVSNCVAIIQEMQFDAVSDQLIHIDFKRVANLQEAEEQAEATVEHAAEVTNVIGMDEDDTPMSAEQIAEEAKHASGGHHHDEEKEKEEEDSAKESVS